MPFFRPGWFVGGLGSPGAAAVAGAGAGLGVSMFAGAAMEGNQSQLGGMGFGAAAGALMGSRWGRLGFAKMGLAMRRNAMAGGWFGRRGAILSNMAGMGVTRRGVAAQSAGVAGLYTAGLIGATALESNQPYR